MGVVAGSKAPVAEVRFLPVKKPRPCTQVGAAAHGAVDSASPTTARVPLPHRRPSACSRKKSSLRELVLKACWLEMCPLWRHAVREGWEGKARPTLCHSEEMMGIAWENEGEVWAEGAAWEREGILRMGRKVQGRGSCVRGSVTKVPVPLWGSVLSWGSPSWRTICSGSRFVSSVL